MKSGVSLISKKGLITLSFPAWENYLVIGKVKRYAGC